jgi:hypothetical protein
VLGQRQAPWNIHHLSMWPDPADNERNIASTRALATAMQPWTTGRADLNFIGDEGQGRVAAAYGREKCARLEELKAKWDPENLFRHVHVGVPHEPAGELVARDRLLHLPCPCVRA